MVDVSPHLFRVLRTDGTVLVRFLKQEVNDRVEPYQIFLILIVTVIASYIQSVTGFGFGIFAMVFFPYALAYTEANLLSSILSASISVFVVARMLRDVDWKNMVFPLIGCMVSTVFAVNFIKSQDNDTLTLLLGIALVVLSVYFFFFSEKMKIKATWYAGLIAGLFSGIMGGMFAMSGPPVVIYFVQSESSSKKYLATISAYFVLSGAFSIGIKIASGFGTLNTLLWLAICFVAMALGTFIGRLTRNKARPLAIRRAVYAVMALSGVVNIVTALAL